MQLQAAGLVSKVLNNVSRVRVINLLHIVCGNRDWRDGWGVVLCCTAAAGGVAIAG